MDSKASYAKIFLESLSKEKYEAARSLSIDFVKRNGLDLEFVGKEFQNDKEVVLAALGNNGLALRFAASGLRKDREVVLAAVKNNGDSLKFAPEDFCIDREIALESLKTSPYIFTRGTSKDFFVKNREFIKLAIEICPVVFRYVSDEYGSDKELAILAIAKDSSLFGNTLLELRSDKEVVLAALLSCGGGFGDTKQMILFFASSELTSQIGKEDPVLFLSAAIAKEKMESGIPPKECVAKKVKI